MKELLSLGEAGGKADNGQLSLSFELPPSLFEGSVPVGPEKDLVEDECWTW